MNEAPKLSTAAQGFEYCDANMAAPMEQTQPTLAEAREAALRLTPEDRHLLALELSSDIEDGSAFWTEMRERIRAARRTEE